MNNHHYPIRSERLFEIRQMADNGVELAKDVLHVLRVWEASQEALTLVLNEERELQEYIEKLKEAAELKWGDSLLDTIYKLRHPDPIPTPKVKGRNTDE